MDEKAKVSSSGIEQPWAMAANPKMSKKGPDTTSMRSGDDMSDGASDHKGGHMKSKLG